jgi:menaquinone-dependent protoporphyrinogen IX oxidase
VSEFRINNGADREKIVAILAEAGYTVRIEKREQAHTYHIYDYFVIVVAAPKLPEYDEAEND